MECAVRELDVFDRLLIAVCKFILKPLGEVAPSIECFFFLQSVLCSYTNDVPLKFGYIWSVSKRMDYA